MQDRLSIDSGTVAEMNRRVRALRLGWLGTVGLYGLFFLVIYLVFICWGKFLAWPGVYRSPENGGGLFLWAWLVSLLVPAVVCFLFIRFQDERNRELITRTWDSWRWFDHGVDMFETEQEASLDQEESFTRAVALDPTDPYAHNNLGSVYLNQGRTSQAVEEFRRAIEQNPEYHKPYSNMGAAYARMGKTKLAVGFYRKALKLKPSDPPTHLNLGVALLRLGKNTQAATHLREFLRLAPGHPRKEEVSGLLSRIIHEA